MTVEAQHPFWLFWPNISGTAPTRLHHDVTIYLLTEIWALLGQGLQLKQLDLPIVTVSRLLLKAELSLLPGRVDELYPKANIIFL